MLFALACVAVGDAEFGGVTVMMRASAGAGGSKISLVASLEWRVIREERFHVTPIGAQQTVNGYVLFACVCRTCMVSCTPRSLMSCAASEPNR